MITTTYAEISENLTEYLDQMGNDRQSLLIKRQGYKDVVLMPANEYTGLLETIHLLRSPKNAERLLASLASSHAGLGTPQSIESFSEMIGFDC